jgi:two-component system OmpR family sensor kinase
VSRPGDLTPLPSPAAPGPGPDPARPAGRPLRQRLLLALVSVSIGSVLLAGMITVVFARRPARAAAIADLRRGLNAFAEIDSQVTIPKLQLQRIRAYVKANQVGLVAVLPDGTIARPNFNQLGGRTPGRLLDRLNKALDRARQAANEAPAGGLPDGVTQADLERHGKELLAGQAVSGTKGPIVFVAQPLVPTADGTPVVVATRRIGVVPLGSLGGVLIVAALVAAGAAALVSIWLVRRLTRPLAAMERTARAIAAGDLTARVEGMAGAEDELAALGEAIDRMAADLERARGLERAFLMSISHDLRTPLTSIRGYAEAVAEGAADDDASRQRAAAIIGAEARRLERLVADLLDLARLDAREFSLHPRLVDVGEVVTGAAEALQPAAGEAGLHLLCRRPDGPLTAEIDPERLGQIVANLVENALKYATTTVEVSVRAVPPGRIQIAVVDDGPGIDPEELPRVFERLYTSRRQPGRKVGTGLGLAIVRELVGAMGGTVEAARTPEGGTRFVVTTTGGGGSTTSSRTGGSSTTSSSASPSVSSTMSTTRAEEESSWSSTPERDTTAP